MEQIISNTSITEETLDFFHRASEKGLEQRQEQLALDAKNVVRMTGIGVPITIAKGMRNYICPKRLKAALASAKKEDKAVFRRILAYADKGVQQRSDMDMAVSDELWSKVCITKFGKKCDKCSHSCKYRNLRDTLSRTSGIVICNQNLLVAHLMNKRETGKGIFNDNCALTIIDETHNLEPKFREQFTDSRSLLGVNGKYGKSHPVIGRSMYNVDDIVDYESATHVQYTIELYKKVTDASGTHYVKLNNISKYMNNVNMEDTKVDLEADRTTDPSKYVYTGEINHGSALDNEKMFEATFSCDVLTGDETHNEYANYKIYLTAQLLGPSNSWKDAYLIYTNAKFDPSVIDETD